MNYAEAASLAPGSVVVTNGGNILFRIKPSAYTFIDVDGFTLAQDDFSKDATFAAVYVAKRTYRAHAPGHYDLIPPDVKMVADKHENMWQYHEYSDTWARKGRIDGHFSAYRMLEQFGPVAEVDNG